MKKIMSAILAATMILALAACGTSGAGTGNTTSTSISTSSAPVPASTSSAPSKTTTLRFAISNSAESINGRTVTHWIESVDQARANGETGLEVVLYPNNQLGKVDEMLEQIMMGENVIVSTDPGALKNWATELAVLEAPYFFENEEEPYLVFKTDWFAQQKKVLEDNGIKVITGELIYGSRHTMATSPIRTPSDMNGLKIRVPGNDLSVSMIEAMGGTATPMALSEVYAAIQQGVIDGMENPFATHIDNNMWEVCDYLSLDGHQVTTTWYVMSAQVFNSLSEQDQKFIENSAADIAAFYNSINTDANNEALQTLRDKGVTIVDDVDIAAFKEATKSVYDKFGYTELREKIYAQMDQFR